MSPELCLRREADRDLAVLVCRFDAPARVLSSGPFGGGYGLRSWALNAQVPSDYARIDIETHIGEISAGLALEGDGAGMLTAADVRSAQFTSDGGVDAVVTVGLGQPTWAAAPDEVAEVVGTINVITWIPICLSPAALVNAVTTIAEAKAQALWDAGVAGTGTATDAVLVACPDTGRPEAFGGPRSSWGARLARATHAAVLAGAR
ncbi:MAG: adenosylcobinamide hydrolase [Acidimicrobiaceae bacterium]